MKLAVVTIVLGEKYFRISQISHKSIKNYADKIGAEFIVLDNPQGLPHWQKMEIYRLLNTYDRIIYFDTDLIIRDDCPNLFEIVPDDKLGAFNEGKFDPRGESLKEAIFAYKEDVKDWDGTYYNTGVMVISRKQKECS